MNKLKPLLLILVTLMIGISHGCKETEKNIEYYFEVDNKDLKLEFDKPASNMDIAIRTNLKENDWQAVSSTGWIFVSKHQSKLKISVATNESTASRTGTVRITSSAKNMVIAITQYGKNELTLEEDIAVVPIGGKASESQPGQGIEHTWDGKFAADGAPPYHSIWNQSARFPVTLDYYFTPGTEIDYLLYHTRSGNGNFGQVDIYIAKNPSHNDFVKYGSYDFHMQNAPSKVTFKQTVSVSAIRFVVKSGAGNFVSCDEMQFFKNNNERKIDQKLLKVFTDITCTEVKNDATEEDIRNLPDEFKRIANALKNNGYDQYEKQFRIRAYLPYSNNEEWAQKLMTKRYSNLDNPTGIAVNSGDEILVLVGDTHGHDITLQCIWESGGQYKQTDVSGTAYMLRPGVNKIKMKGQGQLFVVYNTDLQSPNAKPIKIHIPLGSGKVTGFYDLDEHKSDEKYKELLEKATHKYFAIKGHNIMFYFHTTKLKQFVPTQILSAIHLWDDIISWQHELMGLKRYRPSQFNNHMMAISPEGSYMWASDYCIGFVYTYLNNILLKENVMSAKDNAWGPGHEIGHVHQAAINWPGSTESSNNLFPNYTLYKLGKYCSRGTELCMPKYHDNCLTNDKGEVTKMTLVAAHCVKNSPWWDFGGGYMGENTELHMRMNWQLWNYYHRCGNNPEFWPTLYQLMRDNRIDYSANIGEQQLLFARMASQASQEDLTEFFEMWGFFTITDATVNQYGTYKIKITQDMVDKTKQFMKKFPKKAAPFYYIEDRKQGDVGLDTTPPDVGYYTQFIKGKTHPITKSVKATVNGNKIQITNGEEAVAFEVYKDNKLVYFNTFFNFEIPDYLVGKDFVLKAVAADGNRVTIQR